MKDEILAALGRDFPWRDRIHYVDTTGSTNTDLKAMAGRGAPHGTALIAGSQSAGRGRLGRSFHSPEGKGLYLSLLLRPDCAPGELMHLTCAAGLAACQAVEDVSPVTPRIKWTNDLVVGRQKLGGILTELGFTSQGTVDYAIIGIGINCCHTPEDFPPELQSMATSLSILTPKVPSRAALAAALLTRLEEISRILLTDQAGILERYRQRCVTLGQEISLVRPGVPPLHAVAVDLDNQGALIVRLPDGTEQAVSAGEVSIRGMYGYV